MHPWVSRLLEPWLLRHAERQIGAYPDDVRATLARDLRLVDQRARAAEVLAGHGMVAEALRLQGEALTLARAVTAKVFPPGGSPDPLADRSSEAPSSTPTFDDEAGEGGVRDYERMARATARLHGMVGATLRTPRWILAQRVLRVGLVGVGVLVAAFVASRPDDRVEVTASTFFENRQPWSPRLAIDGRPETEWLTWNTQDGWLDVRFARRSIKKVRLLNAKNVPIDERATRDFRVEAYAGDKLKAAVDGSFGPYVPNPSWLELPLVASRVDRLRFVIKSSHKAGGGLAEIAWVD